MNDHDLKGSVAVVTGAAGGIGRAIARRMGERGAVIAALDVNQQGLDALAAELEDAGIRAAPFVVDLARVERFDAAMDQVVRQLGGVDVLVNNAGALSLGEFADISLGEWHRIMEVNVKAVLFLSIAAGRRMADAGRGGCVVNIGSVAGSFAMQGRAHYCASKAAVATLTKGLALELAAHGIRVAGILPKGIQSGMSGSWLSAADGVTRITAENWFDDPAQRAQVLSTIPVGRPGEPDDIAHAVCFLASRRASWITGSMLAVDGGYLAGDAATR